MLFDLSIICPLVSCTVCVNHSLEKAHIEESPEKLFSLILSIRRQSRYGNHPYSQIDCAVLRQTQPYRCSSINRVRRGRPSLPSPALSHFFPPLLPTSFLESLPPPCPSSSLLLFLPPVHPPSPLAKHSIAAVSSILSRVYIVPKSPNSRLLGLFSLD